jgi:5-amino-6-(5-phosphoribosylamino)uracil reductase
VPERPYVLLSAATSIDGALDDASASRLVLSNPADLDRVDEVRAGCDAILVGAETVRRDDPRLLVRSAARRAARVAAGRPASPLKVTMTSSGRLDLAASFFTAAPPEGPPDRLVYTTGAAAAELAARPLPPGVDVIEAGPGPGVGLAAVLADLAGRGVRRLMVEGGAQVHAQFLAAGMADELHLVIAPRFVGDPAAPRFGLAGPGPRATLAEVRPIGEVVLLRYLLAGAEPAD